MRFIAIFLAICLGNTIASLLAVWLDENVFSGKGD